MKKNKVEAPMRNKKPRKVKRTINVSVAQFSGHPGYKVPERTKLSGLQLAEALARATDKLKT